MPACRLFAALLLVVLLALAACASPERTPNDGPEKLVADPVAFVDPLIGTGIATTPSALRHSEASNEPKGQTYPAVGVPHGMTHWTPQTQATEVKCLSPYYHGDGRLQGFRGSRWMSGSCTQDYGSVTLMPLSGHLRTTPQARAVPFTHADETATPYHYRVALPSEGITADLSASSRAAVLRFVFEHADSAFVVVQPNSDEGEALVRVLPERNAVVVTNPVHRIYQGWGEPAGFSGHAVAVFDRPFAGYGTWRGEATTPGAREVRGDGQPDTLGTGTYVRFSVDAGEAVRVRVGTSLTSLDGAWANLEAEAPAFGLEAMAAASRAAWNEALGRVRVAGGTPAERTTFYTALYHSLLLPRTYTDVDGTYPGFAASGPQQADGWTYYGDFSAWDTYRTLHPLLTIIAPEKARDMARSLVAKAEQGGWMPIFPSWNQYTAAMIGDHTTAILGDAHAKGLMTEADAERAYAKMLQNATETPPRADYVDGKGRRALASYLEYGYIPLEDSVWDAFHKREQVSRTLEYAYNDYVLAQVAERLGHAEDAAMLMQRAANWRHVFDPSVGFVRGRHADGRWVDDFDPAVNRVSWITEGSPWHYTWYVPHDVAGLREAMGGRDAFAAKLDTFFDAGLNWHGNEPTHQIAWLYHWAGAPHRTQDRVRAILREEYGPGPGGLSGNDDTGQMSAWYAMAAMGLYPVTPGVPVYMLIPPLFERVEVAVPGGTLAIRTEGAPGGYVQAATLNGEPYPRAWITHEALMAGGELVYRLGPTPGAWGTRPEDAPPSMSTPTAGA